MLGEGGAGMSHFKSLFTLAIIYCETVTQLIKLGGGLVSLSSMLVNNNLRVWRMRTGNY